MGTALWFLIPSTRGSRPNADGPPIGHTGGFGEPTCQGCHLGNQLNAPGGMLGVEGIPAAYTPNERYRITLVLQSEDMGAAGFQAALRFSGGDHAGTQAGRLEPYDLRVVGARITRPASSTRSTPRREAWSNRECWPSGLSCGPLLGKRGSSYFTPRPIRETATTHPSKF